MPYENEDRFSTVNFNIIANHLRNPNRPTSSPPHSNLHPIPERTLIINDRLAQSQTRDKVVLRLQKELQIKDKIIVQLKNAIKIFDQSTTGSQQPEDSSQLKQYEAEIKILTIENNKLLGIIEKMSPCNDFNKENELWQKKVQCQSQTSTAELTRLKNLLREKESFYEKKIDEFIASHKSLAEQCQQLEQEKNFVIEQNQRLAKSLQEMGRKASARQEGRVVQPEKLTIVKIKEQYAESLRQFQGTITIEIEHLFEVFRCSLQQIDLKVSQLQQKLSDIEQAVREGFLQGLQLKFGRSQSRKSKIYIEEGESSSNGDSRTELRRYSSSGKKPKTQSRICRDSSQEQFSDELIRPLYGEISQLKAVICELESELNEREGYYTFRDRDAQLTAELQACRHRLLGLQTVRVEREIREKSLSEEVVRLKAELAKLQTVYKGESEAVLEMWTRRMQEKEKANLLLAKEVEQMRSQLNASHSKIKEYWEIFELFKQQNGLDRPTYELLQGIKSQIEVYRLKNQQNIAQIRSLQRENKSTMMANRELKIKVQEAISTNHQKATENGRLQQRISALETQKAEFAHRIGCLDQLNKVLQDQLRAKTESQLRLTEEKNSLQQQIVSYLTLFNKVTFTEPDCLPQEEVSLEQLAMTIGKLQASLTESDILRKKATEKLTKVIENKVNEVLPCEISQENSQRTPSQQAH